MGSGVPDPQRAEAVSALLSVENKRMTVPAAPKDPSKPCFRLLVRSSYSRVAARTAINLLNDKFMLQDRLGPKRFSDRLLGIRSRSMG